MLNIFISLRTNGMKYNEAVIKRNNIAKDYINHHKKHKDEIVIIDSLFSDYEPGESNPIEFLGRSIEMMKNADVVLVPVDYKKSKGCSIEAKVADVYGLPVNSYIYTDEKTYFIDGLIEMYFSEKGDIENVK